MKPIQSTQLKPEARSRLTNGSALHPGKIDGRSKEARRWRDLYDAFVAETLAKGKRTETAKQLCRRATTLTILCEEMEGALVRGELVDPSEYARLSGALSRTLRSLGLEPDVVGDGPDAPSLADYLASRKNAG